MIWIVFALMVVAVLAALLVPLLRRRPPQPARSEYDLAVYRDQLAEADRDVERGVLTADQAGAARLEIQRRMLAAGERGGPVAPAAGGGKSVAAAGGGKSVAAAAMRRRPLAMAAAIAVLVPLLAFGIYSRLGSPTLPDQPYAARAALIEQNKAQAAQFQGMVDKLAARLQQQPKDGAGWAMLGRSLGVLGQTDRAQDAYEKALPLLPGDVQVRMEYSALLLNNVPENAPLPPRFVAIMREVLGIDSGNVKALYFVGLAEAQAGHTAQARALLQKVMDNLPPDAPERAEVAAQIEQLK